VDAGSGTRAAHVGAASAMSSVAGASAVTSADAISKLDVAVLCTQAKAALTGLGWKPAIAHAAVAAAVATGGADMTLERLILDALRRCPAPKA
jgi:Holliday junction resolvasome RuvABC DNA-binding subunit